MLVWIVALTALAVIWAYLENRDLTRKYSIASQTQRNIYFISDFKNGNGDFGPKICTKRLRIVEMDSIQSLVRKQIFLPCIVVVIKNVRRDSPDEPYTYGKPCYD